MQYHDYNAKGELERENVHQTVENLTAVYRKGTPESFHELA